MCSDASTGRPDDRVVDVNVLGAAFPRLGNRVVPRQLPVVNTLD